MIPSNQRMSAALIGFATPPVGAIHSPQSQAFTVEFKTRRLEVCRRQPFGIHGDFVVMLLRTEREAL